jgi:hypothetical protein
MCERISNKIAGCGLIRQQASPLFGDHQSDRVIKHGRASVDFLVCFDP